MSYSHLLTAGLALLHQRLTPLGKTAAVVDLLKHLPYLNMDSQTYVFAPSTQPLDYRGEQFEHALQTEFTKAPGRWYIPPYGPFPEWVIPILTGVIRGKYAMLDTTDGTITRLENASGDYEPRAMSVAAILSAR